MSTTLADTDRAAASGVLAAACISTFVVNANTSAVTILLPTMSEDVGAPIAQLQWAVTGYMLVGAAVIVTSGALGDVFGRRRVFLAGLALFIASCVLIALSTGGAGIIIGRLIQGAAGATILACGMSLLSVASSGKGQMRAITLWGAASAAGAAMGPLIGGALVDLSGWQGLFWIDAGIAGWRGDFFLGRNRDAKIGCAVIVPGELLHAGGAVQVATTARRIVGVVDDPVFRAIRRLEEAVVARPEHPIPLLEDRGRLLGPRAGAQWIAAG